MKSVCFMLFLPNSADHGHGTSQQPPSRASTSQPPCDNWGGAAHRPRAEMHQLLLAQNGAMGAS